MSDGSFERLLRRLHAHYRRTRAREHSLSGQIIRTPSRALESELAEIRGYLRGLDKAIDLINEERANNELPLSGGSNELGSQARG